MPSLADPSATLKLFMDPRWVIRRKESIELLNERLVRHRASVDFITTAGQVMPLLVLRKAPGQFTEFDFQDEGGRSIPLPTREDNEAASKALLVEAARQALAGTAVSVTPRLASELAFIATSSADDAVAVLKYRWPGRSRRRGALVRLWHTIRRQPAPAFPPYKIALMANADFRWLINLVARNSIVLVDVPDAPAPLERRVLKLSYVEEVTDLAGAPVAGVFVWARRLVGRVGYRLGWRGYPVVVEVPYAGGQSFHFEFHAPDGVDILEARLGGTSLAPVRGVRPRVHLYVGGALQARTVTAYVQTRIRAAGFATSAVVSAWAIFVILALAAGHAGDIAGRDLGSAPPLMLMFPGLIATYLARPAHPLVGSLLRVARCALLGAAAAAYGAALRLALMEMTTTEAQFLAWFKPLAALALLCALLLTVSWWLPLPLSHWARWPLRRLATRARRRALD